MTIEALPFEHRPRNSIANNLDKINELVDWVNLDTHLYASATGERVTVDDASSVKGLTVDGRSVQDGTPTPDAPVAVQVAGGRNLVDFAHPAVVNTDGGVTFTVNADGSYSAQGTATKNTYIYVTNNSSGFQLPAGRYTFSARNKDGSYPSVLRVGASRWLDGTNTSYSSASDHALTFNHDGQGNVQLIVYVNIGGTVDATVYPQLEVGTTATPYVPYGSIGIVIGDTATPINLQGNTLASLPDGTRDELHIDSAGRVWIDKRVGHTTQAVTDGVTGTVGTDVLSSTGQIVDGADIWYKLTTIQTIDLGYIDQPAIPSGSVVTVSASLTPTIHLEWWVDDGITALIDDLIAYIDYKTEG